MLLLRRKVSVAGQCVYLVLSPYDVSQHVERRTLEQDAEMMRLQLLGDPNLMQQLQRVRPPTPIIRVHI